MIMEGTRVDQAGLLRCCISGLEDIPLKSEVHEGQHAPCKYHDDGGVTLQGNVWVAAWIVKKGKQK